MRYGSAFHAGTDTEHLVKDAALRLVEKKRPFGAAVREAIAQADKGELIDDHEVRRSRSASLAGAARTI